MRKPAYSFQDLEVYQRLYGLMIKILTEVIPQLPKEERFDLVDQLRRSCKAPPALIAEGYAKKNYRKDWQKYLNDAIGECNEIIVHLSCCRDVYGKFIDTKLCQNLIESYTIGGKQLFRLSQSWKNKTTEPTLNTNNLTNNSKLIPTAKNSD